MSEGMRHATRCEQRWQIRDLSPASEAIRRVAPRVRDTRPRSPSRNFSTAKARTSRALAQCPDGGDERVGVMPRGTLKSWHDNGYGFIAHHDGGFVPKPFASLRQLKRMQPANSSQANCRVMVASEPGTEQEDERMVDIFGSPDVTFGACYALNMMGQLQECLTVFLIDPDVFREIQREGDIPVSVEAE